MGIFDRICELADMTPDERAQIAESIASQIPAARETMREHGKTVAMPEDELDTAEIELSTELTPYPGARRK